MYQHHLCANVTFAPTCTPTLYSALLSHKKAHDTPEAASISVGANIHKRLENFAPFQIL